MLRALVAGIIAAFAGWCVQQLALLIDPSLSAMVRDCIGAAVFAGVLLGGLIVTAIEAGEG